MNPIEVAARAYAAKGWSVIPLRPREKKPLIPWLEFQQRRAAAEEITAWWTATPDANVGIVTGKISKLTVMDCDSAEAGFLAAAKGVPPTWRVKTGRGFHYYFQYAEGSRNFQKRDDLPGIDLRSDGGYVCAPPSVHPSGQVYDWEVADGPMGQLPAWALADRTQPGQKKPIIELYGDAQPGTRNDTLARLCGRWIMRLGFEEATKIAHLWNRALREPLPSDEVDHTVHSIWQADQRNHTPDAGGNNSFRAYKSDPPHESHFTPICASDLLAEIPEEIEWILEDFLPAGSLGILAGKPKDGKTTLAYELGVKVAQGLPFLGRTTRQGGVLILAVEEHRRDVKLRLHTLGAGNLEGLFLCVGALSPSPTLFSDIQKFIQAEGVRLVILDTLAAFWRIDNENDASEMTKAVKPLLWLARDSGACLLLIHHARKSEGSHGDEIRGSGALFGLVDVALVMKRHTVENQRLLQAQSRYPDTPSELVLELREQGYVALGDPASVGKAARLKDLEAALPDHWEEADTVTKRAGLSRREGYRLLGLLVAQEKALRDGKGKKSDPFVFRRNSIRATPPPYRHETNNTQTGFDSYDPPSPRTNGNPAVQPVEVVDVD